MLDIRRRIGERSPPGRRSMSMIRRPQPTLVSLLLAALSLVGALGSSAAARTCSSTVPIACGQTLSGALSAVGETDCYQFTVGQGETVSITTQVTAGVFQPCWELQEVAGAVCGQATRSLTAGTYTIEVFDPSMRTGAYDVNLVVVSDTASNCGAPLTCGETLAGNISSVGESYIHRFVAAAHETVSITAQETGGGLSACWELYDPNGHSLGIACGQYEKTLAVAGSYTIRVHDSADAKTGTYDVNLAVVSDTASSCAQALTCGQSLPGNIQDVGQSNTYKFSVEAGETVSITAHQTSAFLVACWELYDPEGSVVFGACGQAEKTLAPAGTYTIRVFDNGDNETGTYDLNLVVISDTASSCAQPILCGDTLVRSIAATGESDTYRFVAAAGEAVSITTRETGGFLTACWEIYDPQGISLGTACGQTEKTLATAGGYTIRVSDNDDTEPGTYDVNLVV